VRNARGQVERIVEHKDASGRGAGHHEVNTGILCLPAGKLAGWLSRLTNKNAQGEYYLTDVIGMAAAEGEKRHSLPPGSGVGSAGHQQPPQLAELERTASAQHRRRLMVRGRHAHRPGPHRRARQPGIAARTS
jgi:bifunctional UDP-N-acetylglucosamine pyrophosphorylase/glucosamine-1-phosphate N-acetyltransferase